MPGSSTRESSPTASSSLGIGRKGRSKRKAKLTGSDAPGSKKKDKNVKDSGGVVAAVTRHGAKFSYVLLYFDATFTLIIPYFTGSHSVIIERL